MGLKIQYRLKHHLNHDFVPEGLPTAADNKNNVIDLSKHRQLPPEGSVAVSEFHNLGIETLQVVGFGREYAKLGEPRGATILREYKIPWKKQGLDIAGLARMRFEENLGSRQICKLVKAPRSTVISAIHRLERERGLR